MSHFYCEVKGQGKKCVTAGGTKNSGMIAHIRGWDIGIKVKLYHNEKTNTDCFIIYQTGGSSNPGELKTLTIGELKLDVKN